MLSGLDLAAYAPRLYVIAATDKMSETKARAFEAALADRGVEVQAWWWRTMEGHGREGACFGRCKERSFSDLSRALNPAPLPWARELHSAPLPWARDLGHEPQHLCSVPER